MTLHKLVHNAFEIKIGPTARVGLVRDEGWVILHAEDGVSKTTISLTGQQALDLASVLRGAGVDALNNGATT